MSTWFSPIYRFAHNCRTQHPFFGRFFVFLFLNVIFFLQLCGIAVCYYIYIFVLCPIIHEKKRACIYLIIYHFLLFLFVWSLYKTYFTPESRVPDRYYETDRALKGVTPFKNGFYRPEESTIEEIEKQRNILYQTAQRKRLIFVEVDEFQRLRYCYNCSLIKPDRCRHCSSCGFCILKFDHHCPFINKCISYRNYKFFILYLIYGIILSIWSALTSLEGLYIFLFIENSNVFHSFLLTGSIIFLGIISFFPFGDLLLYHYYLISNNQTTCDQAKEPIIRDDESANYNIGFYKNLGQVLGWGLWLIPVGTYVEDGIHFQVNYSSKFAGAFEIIRYKRIKNVYIKE